MLKRNLKNTMVVWNSLTDETSELSLITWPDFGHRSDKYFLAWGANDTEVRESSFNTRKKLLNDYLFRWLLEDGFSALTLHQALSPLAEYRALVPVDVSVELENRSTIGKLRPHVE